MSKNLALILLSLLFTIHAITGICSTDAQYTKDGQGFPIAGPLNILSPSNSTFNSCTLFLNVTSNFLLSPSSASLCYSLDGGDNVSLSIEGRFVPIEAVRTYTNGTSEKCISIFSYHALSGNVQLRNLANGSHCLTVFAEYHANDRVGLDARIVCFTVADSFGSIADGSQSAQSISGGSASVLDQGNLSSTTYLQSPMKSASTDSAESSQGNFLWIAVSSVILPVVVPTMVYLKKHRH